MGGVVVDIILGQYAIGPAAPGYLYGVGDCGCVDGVVGVFEVVADVRKAVIGGMRGQRGREVAHTGVAADVTTSAEPTIHTTTTSTITPSTTTITSTTYTTTHVLTRHTGRRVIRADRKSANGTAAAVRV